METPANFLQVSTEFYVIQNFIITPLAQLRPWILLQYTIIALQQIIKMELCGSKNPSSEAMLG